MKAEGRIAPNLDIPTLARVFAVIGDGMFWRRAVDPNFDAKTVMPAIVETIGMLLNPVRTPDPELNKISGRATRSKIEASA